MCMHIYIANMTSNDKYIKSGTMCLTLRAKGINVVK